MSEYEHCKRALQVARVELLNASSRFGALTNRHGKVDRKAYEERSDLILSLARNFVLTEHAFKDASETVGRAITPIADVPQFARWFDGLFDVFAGGAA